MGEFLRSDRPGLYDGLWGPAPDQLRARGHIHGRGLCRLFHSRPFFGALYGVFALIASCLVFGLTVMFTMIITSGWA